MTKSRRSAKNLRLTAPLVRVILSVSMVLIVIISALLWQFSAHWLKGVAANVATTSQAANSSENTISQLQTLQKQLNEHQGTIQKASTLITDSQQYLYQNQITDDLQRFANDAGITIESFTFSAGTTTPSTGGASPPAASSSTPAPSASTPAVARLKTVTETIALKSPVSYSAYIRFLNDIQNNSRKMQITGLSLSRSGDGTLTSQALTIQAYTR